MASSTASSTASIDYHHSTHTSYLSNPNAASSINNHDSRFGCNICLESVVEPVVTLCGHLYCWPCLFRWLEPGMTTDECLVLWRSNSRTNTTHDGSSQTNRRRLAAAAAVADRSRRTCPVCKASCNVTTVVPIYVRGTHESHTSGSMHSSTSEQRQQQQHHHHHHQANLKSWSANAISDDNKSSNNEVSSPVSDRVVETATTTTTTTTTAGLGQRRLRFEQIPARPLLVSPSQQAPNVIMSHILLRQDQQHEQQYSHLPLATTGLAMSLQQAVFGTVMIPPLHHYSNNHRHDVSQQESATEFLSRVLLMLGSFVILCLLLF